MHSKIHAQNSFEHDLDLVSRFLGRWKVSVHKSRKIWIIWQKNILKKTLELGKLTIFGRWGGQPDPWKKNCECWSLFHVSPPPCGAHKISPLSSYSKILTDYRNIRTTEMYLAGSYKLQPEAIRIHYWYRRQTGRRVLSLLSAFYFFYHHPWAFLRVPYLWNDPRYPSLSLQVSL